MPVLTPTLTEGQRRAHWLKTLTQWHWISSAVCLMGMLLFSFTGITLNHASQIESAPQVTTRRAHVPMSVLGATDAEKRSVPLDPTLSRWLRDELDVDAAGREAEWSADEIYLSLPRPGGDAWLRIDRTSGDLEYEITDRGWLAFANDLHKGRHTGLAWSWFIDLFAAACLVFSVSGLLILKLRASKRAATWPFVGLGAAVPLLLVIAFIH
jgi:hypothetical protein